MRIFGTTACWPGSHYQDAVARLVGGTREPYFGELAIGHLQLCPQNSGLLDDSAIAQLVGHHPATRFRLHSNARVSRESRPGANDAIDYSPDSIHFQEIVRVSRLLGAPAYTLHPGKRTAGSLALLASRLGALQDRMQVPVGVEGMYPTGGSSMWLLDTWDEYRWLLQSNVYYAIDLSHVNILVRRSHITENTLLAELLASERCIEVHVSGNDGLSDRHETLEAAPWWATILQCVHSGAAVFSEGNQMLQLKKRNPTHATNY